MDSIVSAKNLKFSYFQEGREVPVIHDLSFKIPAGEFVAIQGSSGSGKSTLLYLLGGMNPAQGGSLKIAGLELSEMGNAQAALFRNRFIGFIFQQFHLLPRSTVLENILLPATYPLENPTREEGRDARAEFLVQELGLAGLERNGPQQLSGGQQQRVAIARALMNDGPLILADEPTGNLDSANTRGVMELLKKLNAQGKTIILITHDSSLAQEAQRIITLKDGRIVSDVKNKSSNEVNVGIKERWGDLQKPFAYLRDLDFFSAIAKAAAHNLFKSRLRSYLTMLGISIGIAAILSTLTLGEFAKEKILASYATLGVHTLDFYGYNNYQQKATDRVTSRTFNGFSWEKDLAPLNHVFPEIVRISPELNSYNSTFSYGGRTLDQDGRIYGINEQGFEITKFSLMMGTKISRYHVDNRSAVCVIGSEVLDRLFSQVNPLGQILLVSENNRAFSCKIIGVLKPLPSKSEWRNANARIYVPYTFYQSMSGDYWTKNINDVWIELNDRADSEKTGQGIRAFFERKYGTSGKFRVDSDSLLIDQMNRFLNVFSGFLAALAVVSLGVGGIGITNMMMVSISERFREIGLRKALGATDLSLRWQLLLESVFLCALAGVIGITCGFAFYELIIWAAGKVIPKLEFEWVFSPGAFLFSTVSILAVGVLSGIIPALRAEKLSAMDALRYE